jgi:hypothetical protein
VDLPPRMVPSRPEVCKHCPIRSCLSDRPIRLRLPALRARRRSISYARPVVAGGILIAVVMLLLLPVAVMLGGAIWSALLGWLLVDDAEHRAAPEQPGTA